MPHRTLSPWKESSRPARAAGSDGAPRAVAGRRGLALTLAVALSLQTIVLPAPPAWAQADRLPDLGSAGGDDLSPSAERRLGDSIMRQIRAEGVLFDDAELAEFANRFAARLANTVPARGQALEFFIVRDRSINAFALPGGYIGIHTGLIAVAQSESELATVLAHEIGHVTQRHIARMLGQQRQASTLALAALVLGALAARSSGDAAMGALTLGESLAARQVMAFSRDAEREADRVGLDMLREGQFDVRAAPRLFERLQQANRYNEGNFPAYLRSHPVTGERMTDMELRIQAMRPIERPDSLEFKLIRARSRAIGSDNVDALREARTAFEDQTRGDGKGEPAPWFGLANVAAEQRDWATARQALARTQQLLGDPHPYTTRLGIAIALAAGDVAGALSMSRSGIERFPDRLSIVRLRAASLLAGREYKAAVELMRDRTVNNFRGDPECWRLLSEAYQGNGEIAFAHHAAAEGYLLRGLRLPAIEQLRAAQRAGDLDYYTGSIVEAKLREQERLYLEELKDAGRR